MKSMNKFDNIRPCAQIALHQSLDYKGSLSIVKRDFIARDIVPNVLFPRLLLLIIVLPFFFFHFYFSRIYLKAPIS